MPSYQEEDIAHHALELLSITSTWLLVRHQWLIDTMRCVLTGENPSALTELKELDQIIPTHLKVSESLMQSFTEVKVSLEASWTEATKAFHPMSGLTIFEQLNNYQASAHKFMLASKEANQKLLHEFAMRDPLTGAWTRLPLTANLSDQLKYATRYKEPSTIALLDQDKFKLINDQWGHVVGDQVLAKTAGIIQSNLRTTDKLFRFGGDEWLILMPATTKIQAKNILERIQETYGTYKFKSNTNESFFTSFSYGVAESNETLSPKEWVMNADSLLYENKNRMFIQSIANM